MAYWINFYLCDNSDNSILNNETINHRHRHIFSLEHVKKVRDGDLYTPKLQKLNSNRLKYGHAYGMMKKAIDLALATNSYDELISTCQDFLNSKQEIKGRPVGRAKSVVEIQDKENN
ncbi:hypothetical protein Glove_441g115 [Diversispora epigaea]|uniref:Uncharacterized protein n=1 Tax=Diversispora epigaea TaxID=1348612 RepID=A0A397GVI8_9GLOM|nr:hypothetical protein Glove_441g115 [Diversispora epigaea]